MVGAGNEAAALRYKRWPHRGCTRGACPKLPSGRGTGGGHPLRANSSSPSDSSLDLTVWLVLSGGYDQVDRVDWEGLSCFCAQTAEIWRMITHPHPDLALLMHFFSFVF